MNKQEMIEALPTETIRMIVDSVDRGPGHLKTPSESHPLAGVVRIEGIGHVDVKRLRRELERRA